MQRRSMVVLKVGGTMEAKRVEKGMLRYASKCKCSICPVTMVCKSYRTYKAEGLYALMFTMTLTFFKP